MATFNIISKLINRIQNVEICIEYVHKNLSARLKDRNIVNSIHPGWVKKLSTAGAPLSTEFSARNI
jgi:hypothetical protein